MSYRISLFQAINDLIDNAIYEIADTVQFYKSNGIDRTQEINNVVGALSVTRIVDCGNHRFDFAKDGEKAVVFEALAEDAVTTLDLVAWPLGKPAHVMTMFGKCGILGGYNAYNAATYCMDDSLAMYRTPLELFLGGFDGSAIIEPTIAARQMLDIPGRIAARDYRHGKKLEALMQSVVPKNKILVPQTIMRKAA